MKARDYRTIYENTREMIIKDIQDALANLPEKSIDLTQTSATCTIEQIDDQESVTAMGLTLNTKGFATVHAGVYDECSRYGLQDLWFETLLDLYDAFEEAINDNPEPYIVE